ncbi:MAG: hypothetical protein JWO96_288 [Candidatus Saccharibacteria bacterium]|nr:hypothetical protein [Candidatus Saccharibacteria bacterium]
MKRIGLAASIAVLAAAAFLGQIAHAVWAPNDLTIIQLKMTGSETIVIENTSAANINLSNYLLQYFNKSAPASLAVPTSTQQLPGVTLLPKQTILISGDSSVTCGAAAVANESFTLSDTSGYLMAVKVAPQPDGSLVLVPQDHVSWTSAANGADISHVPSNTTDPNAVWYRKLNDGSWQQAVLGSDCATLLTLISLAATPSFVQWADGTMAPSSIISLASSGSGGSIPIADIGLAAPQITEILPNPASPQSDGEDEFIEIYNPNSVDFDLSGFKLEVGTTTKRSYTIPDGTYVAAKEFKAFFSVDTGLSMSNSGGQARLIDPLGTVLSQTEPYGSAKDGQVWALANGQWYWSLASTPSAANVVNQAGAKSTKTSTSKSTAVKGASTSAGFSPTPNSPASGASTAAVHPWTIAGVGSAALLYAGYEYRADLANNLYRLRRYWASRRNPRL